jgi:hypothetical protein
MSQKQARAGGAVDLRVTGRFSASAKSGIGWL